AGADAEGHTGKERRKGNPDRRTETFPDEESGKNGDKQELGMVDQGGGHGGRELQAAEIQGIGDAPPDQSHDGKEKPFARSEPAPVRAAPARKDKSHEKDDADDGVF